MKRIESYRDRLLVGLGVLLAGHVAGAQESVSSPVPAVVLEIDAAAFKIDVGEHVRQIDSSLRKAKVRGDAAQRPVQVAAAEKRARG